MTESVVIPADRDVRGSLDSPDSTACVVACPPHPQMGGSRTDARLQAVSEAVDGACLRFDYGAFDDGHGELRDTLDAMAWARERYEAVAVFGYSFGGCLALCAAATATDTPVAVSALAPADRLDDDLDAVAAVDAIDCPKQVVYGERDTTVDAERVADRVRARGGAVETLSADHFFVGQTRKIGETVGRFLNQSLNI